VDDAGLQVRCFAAAAAVSAACQPGRRMGKPLVVAVAAVAAAAAVEAACL